MKKIRLYIHKISDAHEKADSFVLILEEENTTRILPLVVGRFEAQAIAMEIEKVVPNRPMTHDLFVPLASSFNFHLKEVLISALVNKMFMSKMIWTDGSIDKEFDSRPSDAIAVALRMNAPIYCYEHILDEAGMLSEA